MRILILYDAPRTEARADELDTQEQARAIRFGLEGLGHEVDELGVSLDLAALERRLRSCAPDLVFNLVESLGGHGRLIPCVPMLLEALGLPYCGAPALALERSSDKLGAKRALRAARLPTPDWLELDELRRRGRYGERLEGAWILKSVWEHASLGLDEDSVFHAPDSLGLAAELAAREPSLGGRGFAERYVDGREFNLGLLAALGGEPEVLPLAEIVFEGYGPEKPKVVGWRAKWDPTSAEYHRTPRRFLPADRERRLRKELARIALAAWRLFDLHGWARVDFRLDEEGRPFVLEVNANPCLAPDAGFAAALHHAGLPFPEALRRILEDRC